MTVRSRGSSLYTWLVQPRRGYRTYYTQLERADHDAMRIVTVFKCDHRHRQRESALLCPDVRRAFLADEDPRMARSAAPH